MKRRSVRFCIVLVLGGALLALTAPRLLPARVFHSGGGMRVCRGSMENIAMAIQMYARDHQGRFPPQVDELVPQYLRQVPACPGAGQETPYRVELTPDRYTVVCQARWHLVESGYKIRGASNDYWEYGEGYPRLTMEGEVEKGKVLPSEGPHGPGRWAFFGLPAAWLAALVWSLRRS